MPSSRIAFSESAIRDLTGIREWYAKQDVPHVGERILRELMSAVERLEHFPESGRVVPEFGIPSLREVVHPPFRIVYRTEKDRVVVVRVWRSERDMTSA